MALEVLFLFLSTHAPTNAQNVKAGTSLPGNVSWPSNSVGLENEYYLDLLSGNVYGPKTLGTWPHTPTATFNPYQINIDPRAYGAHCDGVTNDDAAFTATQATLQNLGGGNIIIPATGHSCLITGLSIYNGVGVIGTCTMVNAGTTGSLALWTSAGSWLQNTSLSNPTITMAGSGNTVSCVNFIRAQPTPSSVPSTAYTPTAYTGYEIDIKNSFAAVSNVRMIGVNYGIILDYDSTHAGGTYTWLSHIGIDAMYTSFRTSNVNDTIHVTDVHARSFFYAGNSNLVTFREANAIGWAMGYTDNPMVHGFECFQTLACISASNQTVNVGAGNVSHSGYNLQITGLDCNLNVQCITAAVGSTLSGTLGDTVSQQDNNQTVAQFNLPIDNLDITFDTLSVPRGSHKFMIIGNGTGGVVKIGTLNLGSYVNGTTQPGYSADTAGQVAFTVNAGAKLKIGRRDVYRLSTAGAFIAGAGADNVDMPTFCWTPYAAFGQATVTASASSTSFTVDNFENSAHYGGFVQVRLRAQPYISTAAVGSTLTISMGNFPTSLSSTAISLSCSSASTGYCSTLDTNWVEVADTGTSIGRANDSDTSGASVAFQFGPLTFCGR